MVRGFARFIGIFIVPLMSINFKRVASPTIVAERIEHNTCIGAIGYNVICATEDDVRGGRLKEDTCLINRKMPYYVLSAMSHYRFLYETQRISQSY